jgi:HD-like signal output (HDOD) protein
MKQQTTAYWVEKLTTIEMPILSAVVKQLSKLTGDDETEVAQLAEVVLKDPHMTSQVLKIANSVQYNPISASVNTVSRAIVLLGFQGVRSLCLSLMMVDSLLRKTPRDRLLETMAKAFHAAVLARAMYQKTDNTNLEEVFIAALLYNLGEMTFWAYGGQTADKLECADSDHQAIEKALGTSFRTLSKEIGKVWHLGPILQDSLSESKKKSLPSQAVELGDAYSQLNINDEKELIILEKKIAGFTGESLSDTKLLIKEASEAATLVAVEFGAAKVCHLISGYKDVTQKNSSKKATILTADSNLQLKILRDLSNAVSDSDLDGTTVFQMAFEGMHRGIGLERAVLAFFHQDKVKLKFVLGEHTDGWREKFSFDVSKTSANIFSDCVKNSQPTWLDQAYFKKHQDILTHSISTLLGNKPAFIGVLRINTRNAALFYADRGHTSEALNDEHFDAFKHFLNQSELSIQAMANKKKP